MEGCEGAGPCHVRNGTWASVEAGFSPTDTHHELMFRIGIWLLGIPIPIEQPELADQACLILHGGCPLVAGEGERSFGYSFEIISPIVGPTVLIELNLIDSNTQQSVSCGGVQVTITA